MNCILLLVCVCACARARVCVGKIIVAVHGQHNIKFTQKTCVIDSFPNTFSVTVLRSVCDSGTCYICSDFSPAALNTHLLEWFAGSTLYL
jgi:hypothetical protein